jgi:hypothetical protein
MGKEFVGVAGKLVADHFEVCMQTASLLHEVRSYDRASQVSSWLLANAARPPGRLVSTSIWRRRGL